MKRPTGFVVLFVALLCMTFVPVSTVTAQSPEQAYREAVEAFEAGRYEAARDGFLAARRGGMDTPALSYSLGATWYRLGANDRAAEEFGRLLAEPRWRHLAHYNLGLIARRQGDEAEARRHFRAASQSTDAGLAQLARRALGEDRESVPARGTPAGLLSLGVGHDSNVTLSPDAGILGVSDDADSFLEALATGRLYLTPDAQRPLRLDGAILMREYLDVDRFDETALLLGLFQESRYRDWNLQWGGSLDTVYIDGRHFQDVVSFKGEGRRPVGTAQTLALGYALSRIEAANRYDYLTGWRHRLQGEWRLPVGEARMRLGYTLDINDRKDLSEGGEFASYSPVRHLLHAQADTDLNEHLNVRGRLEYHHSRYRDPHRLGGLTRTREDELWLISLRGSWRLERDWALFADVSHSVNDSSLREYEYDRTVVMGGVEYLFGR
jgi:tetratricopeptide (TPR) repeat protein